VKIYSQWRINLWAILAHARRWRKNGALSYHMYHFSFASDENMLMNHFPRTQYTTFRFR
jgi:hypothetical protein